MITGWVTSVITLIVGAFVGAWWLHHKDEARITNAEANMERAEVEAAKMAAQGERLRLERNAAMADRDEVVVVLDAARKANALLSEECAQYHQSINDAQAMIGRAQVQNLADAQEITRLRQQLSEVVYEVKPNIAVDVATEPPVIVQYEVKTPRKRAVKAVALISGQSDLAAGTDGEV